MLLDHCTFDDEIIQEATHIVTNEKIKLWAQEEQHGPFRITAVSGAPNV